MSAVVWLVLGAFAGWVGRYVLQVTKQRSEELHWLRDRMLAAADEFATSAMRVTAEIGAKSTFDMNDRDDAFAQVKAYRLAHTEAAARLPRVDLLFGVESPSAEAARAELHHLGAIRKAAQAVLDATRGEDHETKVAAWAKLVSETAPLQMAFRQTAQKAVARPKFVGL